MNVKGKWSGAKLSAAVVNGQCIVTANDQVVLVLNIAAAKSAPDHSEHSPVGPPIIKLHKVDQLVWTKTGPHIRFDSESTTGPHPEFWMELNIDHFEYPPPTRRKRKTCGGGDEFHSIKQQVDYTQVAALLFFVIDEDFAVEVPIGLPRNFDDPEPG